MRSGSQRAVALEKLADELAALGTAGAAVGTAGERA